MSPVEIVPIEGVLILRARGSELLILNQHVCELKALKQPKEFVEYFMQQALINRPARKLFEAWLRKDNTLWKRVFTTVHKEMENLEAAESTKDELEAVVNDQSSEPTKAADEPEARGVPEAPSHAPVAKSGKPRALAEETGSDATGTGDVKKSAAKSKDPVAKKTVSKDEAASEKLTTIKKVAAKTKTHQSEAAPAASAKKTTATKVGTGKTTKKKS